MHHSTYVGRLLIWIASFLQLVDLILFIIFSFEKRPSRNRKTMGAILGLTLIQVAEIAVWLMADSDFTMLVVVSPSVLVEKDQVLISFLGGVD